MADGDDEEEKEEEEEKPNGCIQCLEWTWWGMKGFYYGVKFCVMAICNGLAYCWYPFKERCVDCCDCCNRCMN